MIVFWEQNLVILSVPKTGSTSLEHAIGPRASAVLRRPPAVKHMPIGNYKRFFKPLDQEWDHAPEFMAVIRHPVDWLGSWFRYRRRADLKGQPNSTLGMSFDAFVLEYCKERPAPAADVGSQFQFVMVRQDSEIGVEHLFRYEAQAAIKEFLTDRLDLDFTLPRLNMSERMALSLSPQVEETLRQARANEFWIWEQARTSAKPSG